MTDSTDKSPQPPADPNYTLRLQHVLLILGLALVFRSLYLFESSRQPDFNLFSMDQEYNLEWARAMASDNWQPPYDQLKDAVYFRAPLYSYFLSLVLAVTGGSLLLARIVQIVLGSVSCVLAYGVFTKCFGRRVGLVTGLLCSVYWVLAYFDSEFLLPVLLVFLALLAFFLLFLAMERSSPALTGLAGLVFGLYSITRPNILLFFPVLVLWAIFSTYRSGIRKCAWFVALLSLGCALPPAAVTVRNRVVADDWVLVASQGGVNFYIGNNPESNGMQAMVPGTRPTWWGGREDTVAIAERVRGRPLRPSEVSNFWFGRAFAYIRERPGHWLILNLRKTAVFFTNVEIPNNEPYEVGRRDYWTFRIVPLGFGILFALFALSLPQMVCPCRLLKCEEGEQGSMRQGFSRLVLLFLIVYAASIIAFFVTGRYRVPLLPFFAGGAGLTLVRMGGLLRKRRFLYAGVLVAVSALLTCVFCIDYFKIRKKTGGWVEFTDAQHELALGNIDSAIEKLETIRRSGSVRVADVYTSLARAYVRRQRPDDLPTVLAVAKEGLSRFPDQPELLWYAATVNMEQRNWKKASAWVEKLLVLQPENIPALQLAYAAARADGRIDDAGKFWDRAEKMRTYGSSGVAE